MIKIKSIFIVFVLILLLCSFKNKQALHSSHDLIFGELPDKWYEAIPLGNGIIGALIWQKGGNLRISLDRSDLWDLRPLPNLNTDKFKFRWVYNQWKNNTYENVQKQFDIPYNLYPAPTKIPAGAIEFLLKDMPEVSSVHLFLNNALCQITLENGNKILFFVQANKNAGWFFFENIRINPIIVPPGYNDKNSSLSKLKYAEPIIQIKDNFIKYIQKGWGDFRYEINIKWEVKGNSTVGCWNINSFDKKNSYEKFNNDIDSIFNIGFFNSLEEHRRWWNNFWEKSSVHIPDSIIEKQYYLEIYKLGSTAREGTPPISLQGVWTADNNELPPWKGDYHHDLNTELSYWPVYKSNHLDIGMSFITWLEENKEVFLNYTKRFFGVNGINVPGVTTISGEPMGGWIQYAFGPTVSAWIGQNYYFYWEFTKDTSFLENKAYPWLKNTSIYLSEMLKEDEKGKLNLPISSSPEIFDNSSKAWFNEITNFDLALIKYNLLKTIELARILEKYEDLERFEKIYKKLPDLAVSDSIGLLLAPNRALPYSHRHLSHLMAIYPLNLLSWYNSEEDREVIKKSIEHLKKLGSSQWVGYSFCWFANILANCGLGNEADSLLKIFATAFCSKNSFHLNGDQSNKNYSNFKYNPFTLEGNFAFASAVLEMLIQFHNNVVYIFPAIPEYWHDVSFKDLRINGAFLISAKIEKNNLQYINIKSLTGGDINIYNLAKRTDIKYKGVDKKNIRISEELIQIRTVKDDNITLYFKLLR